MGCKRYLLTLTTLVVLTINFAPAADEIYIQARVNYDSPGQLAELFKRHLDIMYAGDQFIEIVTDDKELEELRSLGYDIEIIHEDMVAFYQSRYPDKDRSGYLTLSQVISELFFYHIMYPDITTDTISIGQTLEGRNIYAFKISDNPEIDEDEPEVFYNGAIHAREVITPLVLLHFIDYLLSNYGSDPQVTEIVNERELWFVLVVNPDGYQYNVDNNWPGGMWRKNRRDNGDGSWGVDLNRNFGYMWGYDNDGSSPVSEDETYRGTGPFSEPSSQVIRDFVLSRNFVLTMNYHSCSNLYLWAYSYNNSFTPDEDIFSALGDSMNVFSGYTPDVDAIGYPVNGGVDDWMYGEQTLKDKIFAITPEVGNYYADGFWPETFRIPELVEENLQPNLLIAEIADHIEKVLPPQMPLLSAPDSVEAGVGYDIDWSCDDQRNPPVNYELVEMSGFNILTDAADNFNNWDHRLFELSSGTFYSGGDNFDHRYIQTIRPYTILPNDTLKFKTKYALSEDIDYAYAQISTDGVHYISLEGNITTTYNPHGLNMGYGITGYTGEAWVDAYFDLSEYAGQTVYFRIYYKVFQMAWVWDGIRIDDISPVPGFDNFDVVSSSLTDTSYTIPGRSEGIYFYKVKAQDSDGQWGDYSETEMVVVGSPTICVDPDGDGYGNPGYPGSSCPDDNCAYTYNPDQADYDVDGVGDVCDYCTDTDGDGFGNPGFAANICDEDNCPDIYNPEQSDPDEDGVGALCDNCPETPNPNQADTDEDGLGDACDFLCGDPDGSWAINLLDITYLINYLYKDGPAPVSLVHADVNSTGDINLMDIVYLISYKYKGGPEPNCTI